ncbi:MAG: hypothetical protein ACTSQF_15265, partial [Candidatus Heimdallarchaeaceae archaeon]
MTKQTIPNSKPLMGRIIAKEEECEDTYKFLIELPIKAARALPGQFIMLWVPGVDEFPLGIAGLEENILEIGIAKMGPGSEAMIDKQIGDYVGIRGFYGKPFKPPEDVNHLLIGGGFGVTILKLLTTTLLEREKVQNIHVFEGARTKDRLMYLELFQELHDKESVNFHVCTDDG